MADSTLDQIYYERVYGLNPQSNLQEKINLDEGFFEELCYKKLEEAKLDPAELVKINRFITIVEKINERYPFLYLPNFIKDFMTGIYSKHLLTKYHLRSYGELSYIKRSILQLKAERVKKHENSLENNLAIPGWDKLYNFLINESQNFYEILLELINHNLLRAIIILYLLEKKTKINKSEIIQNIETIFRIYKNKINVFDENEFPFSFNEYLKTNLESKIDAILTSLEEKNYIIKDTSDGAIFLISPKYQDISKKILEILERFYEGTSQSSFHKILLKELPLLKLIPNVGLWESFLDQLEKNRIVIRKKAFWRFRPFKDQLFTQTNYEKIMKLIHEQNIQHGRKKFSGRHITPEQFIEELIQLEKGSLDAIDDQVTRLAGLVLAESAIVQSPPESFEEFDFAVDLSNYDFRPEQLKSMKLINLELRSKIIHCKVMINEKISEDIIKKIKQKLPPNEQVIIFSFENIPKTVTPLLQDKSIQIIDKNGIKIWSSITPIIPCRLGAISKVIYGDLRGKIVKINSLNYESSLAEVIIIPTMEKTNLYIGSLEEIPLNEPSLKDYETFSKNYFEFLNIIVENSTVDEFEKGFFDAKIQNIQIVPQSEQKISETLSEAMKRTKREGTWIIELENSTVKIGLSDYGFKNIFNCSCYYWDGKNHSYKFCNHMISALNHIGFEGKFFDETWEMGNSLSAALREFIVDNDNIIIKKLAENLEPENVNTLKQYLDSYCKLKKS